MSEIETIDIDMHRQYVVGQNGAILQSLCAEFDIEAWHGSIKKGNLYYWSEDKDKMAAFREAILESMKSYTVLKVGPYRGFIVGKGGETIKMIRQESGCVINNEGTEHLSIHGPPE